MFKDKKERLKTLAVIAGFGVVGIAAAIVATAFYPFIGVVPAVSFTILYAAIALNFIIANNIVDNVKGYLLDRFCKSFSKKHPKANDLYGDLLLEREKLNEMLNKYNKLPFKTLEESAYKDRQFAVLEGQKNKYNNLFKMLGKMSKTDVSAFNKYNNLNKGLVPIIIKKQSVTEKAVVGKKVVEKEKVATATYEKKSNKSSKQVAEQEQEVIVQPIGQDIISKLKSDNQSANKKPVSKRSSSQGGHAEFSAEHYKNK